MSGLPLRARIWTMGLRSIPAVEYGARSPGSEDASEDARSPGRNAISPRDLGGVQGGIGGLEQCLDRRALVAIGRQPCAERHAKGRSGDLALQEVAADIHTDPLGREPRTAAVRAGQHDRELVPPVA